MSTMVDRVARAIYEKAMGQNPLTPLGMLSDWPAWEDLSEGYRENARGEARAAIEAMLEPTEAMILSQGKSKPENAATETQRERAEALNLSVRRLAAVTWREMIQAALKEQE